MSKKQLFFIILVTVIVSWMLNLLFGRQLVAKISTLPLLNRWHILSPEAPIVITNRETVRVSGGVDMKAVGDSVKSKISSVVLVSNGSVQITGSALNLTSDGNFVTGAATFVAGQQGVYYVVTNDGKSSKITSQSLDPATGLVFLKTNLAGEAVINFADSKDANPGEVIIFSSASLQNFKTKVLPGEIISDQSDNQGQVFQSDYPRRSFAAQVSGTLLSGEGIFDANSDNLGIWNGKEIISSDVLKQALNLYLSSEQKIIRPGFGFSYQIISVQESAMSGQIQGLLIKSVALNSPAHAAGLVAGDIITVIGSQRIDGTISPEEILQNYKAGDLALLIVMRGKNALNLKISVGELK